MIRKLCRRWSGSRKDILSFKIFQLDVIEGFKYRKKSSWLCLFMSLAILFLIVWGASYDTSLFEASNYRVVFYALFYFPLVITLAFCFRACLIYSPSHWDVSKNKKISTKKSVRALVIFQISIIPLIVYYGYWVYRLWQRNG